MPNETYETQAQLQMFTMRTRQCYCVIWQFGFFEQFMNTSHKKKSWKLSIKYSFERTGAMLVMSELKPCRGREKQAIMRADELSCLQGSNAQAPIVVSLLCISQIKLSECIWPFTHSLFSITRLHPSSPLPSLPACSPSLTTCLFSRSISPPV